MKKTVILSSNDNESYLPYLPYVQKAWNTLGWDTLTFYSGEKELVSSANNQIVNLDINIKYKAVTQIQVSRLFGHKYIKGLIMTADIDMIPLCNYWNPKLEEITCFGSDLTKFKHHPICYIAASHDTWNKLIPEASVVELLDKYPKAKRFSNCWDVDQDIITERVNSADKKISKNIRLRGFNKYNLAYGRIDRYKWNETKESEDEKIDAHMPHPFNKDSADYILEYFFQQSKNE